MRSLQHSALSGLRMTASERVLGRFLRAPEGHSAPAADAAPAAETPAAAAAAAADTPAETPEGEAAAGAADDAVGSILGDAASPGDDAAGEQEGAADDADAASGDAADAEVVPFEGLTPPEGFEALDADALTAATPILRELGVETTEQAQAVVGKFAPILSGMVEKAVTAHADAAKTAQVELARTWADETKADPEIGGNNYPRTVANAAKVLDTFFSPTFREFLTVTGLGNHPEMVRGVNKIATQIEEGSIHLGGAETKKLEPHQKIYDPVYDGPQT